jgi:hypothetical protein
MKFILLVEGKTERDSAASFLKRRLDPQLKRPVGVQTVSFDGYADWIRKLETKARMYLDGPKRDEIVGVIGLLDLHGPDFFPEDKKTAEEKFLWGKEYFEKKVDRERFRMFFAVHEFEAWLLSLPDLFPSDVRNALVNKIAYPERVNFDEPPAKLLDRIYRKVSNRNYKKTTYGKQLFAKLDPEIAAEKCPYLKLLFDEMLLMAKTAGL